MTIIEEALEDTFIFVVHLVLRVTSQWRVCANRS